MEQFRFNTDSSENTEWYIKYKVENGDLTMLNKLRHGLKLKNNEDIHFELCKIDEEQISISNPSELDLLFWKDAGAIAACSIISEKMKNIIEPFNIPDHSFLPIKINYGQEFINNNYFFFTIYGNVFNLINYSKSEFIKYKINKTTWDYEILEHFKGKYKTREEFSQDQKKQLKNTGNLIRLQKAYLEKEYDLIWGIPNEIRITNKVFDKLNRNNLKGVGLKPKSDDDPVFIQTNEQ